LKPNYLAIIGGIMALASLALPWWTMTVSANEIDTSVNVYPHSAIVNGKMVKLSVTQLMFGWAALVFAVIGGFVGVIAGALPNKAKRYYGRRLNFGSLGFFSVVLFAIVLQRELLDDSLGIGALNVSLLGSGQLYFADYGINANYFAYLSYGFWLALAAAIILFFAFRNKPAETALRSNRSNVQPMPF